MSFFDEIQKSWEKGKKGTEDVPLDKGIQAVFKVAQRANEEVGTKPKEKIIDGK